MAQIGIEPWEPEETVGKLWHAFASRLDAPVTHEDAGVDLAPLERRLAIFLRGLGGGGDIVIAPAARAEVQHRLSLRRKLGTAHEREERASFDGETLRLPPRIALFDDAALNEALYFWLVASAAVARPTRHEDDPLRRDLLALQQAESVRGSVLREAPGLGGLHARLADACHALRPPLHLPESECAIEAVVVHLLGGEAPRTALARRFLSLARTPDTDLREIEAPKGYRPFATVPIWLAPLPWAERAEAAEADAEPGGGDRSTESGETRKARRAPSDQAERRDSLILHKFEAIFSWAEFLNINRKVEDEDPDAAKKAAEDADEIVLGQVSKKPATRLKLHLDLSPADVDREALSGAHLYPEWDARNGRYLADHARVLVAPAEASEVPPAFSTDQKARRRIERVRRQFEALRPARMPLTRQLDGDEIDLDAAIRSRADLRAAGEGADRVWRASRPEARSLAVSILLDASRSTESACGPRTVIDVEREALVALAWGLDACGDDTAVSAFSSLRRDRVFVHEIKGFDEAMRPEIEARIAGLRPGFYTRLGAAIRHAAGGLAARQKHKRLLLVITDGKPNDLDHYEGRHGVEDSRMAVREARRAGAHVHGVIVNERGHEWHTRIFGKGHCSVVPEAEKLTGALPAIYRSLTGA